MISSEDQDGFHFFENLLKFFSIYFFYDSPRGNSAKEMGGQYSTAATATAANDDTLIIREGSLKTLLEICDEAIQKPGKSGRFGSEPIEIPINFSSSEMQEIKPQLEKALKEKYQMDCQITERKCGPFSDIRFDPPRLFAGMQIRN